MKKESKPSTNTDDMDNQNLPENTEHTVDNIPPPKSCAKRICCLARSLWKDYVEHSKKAEL